MAAINTRYIQSHESVIAALEPHHNLSRDQVKQVVLHYCEYKLNGQARTRSHVSYKLELVERKLSHGIQGKQRLIHLGWDRVFVEVRRELGLPLSAFFLSQPSSRPASSTPTASTPLPPPSDYCRQVTRDRATFLDEGIAPPPAWSPPLPSVLPPSPQDLEEQQLASAVRESLALASSSSCHASTASDLIPTPSLTPTRSFSPFRPTFRSAYLTQPLPKLKSPSSVTDPLNILSSSRYQTLFLIDDPSPKALDALSKLVPLVSLLSGGVGAEVFFVRSSVQLGGCTTADEAREVFEAVHDGEEGEGGLGRRLEEQLLEYVESLEEKGEDWRVGKGKKRGLRERREEEEGKERRLNLIVLTDGTSPDDLESVLFAAAHHLDRLHASQAQVGVFFLQFGTNPLAASYLRSLTSLRAKFPSLGRDLVDTTRWRETEAGGEDEAVLLRKILLGGINARVREVKLDEQSSP